MNIKLPLVSRIVEACTSIYFSLKEEKAVPQKNVRVCRMTLILRDGTRLDHTFTGEIFFALGEHHVLDAEHIARAWYASCEIFVGRDGRTYFKRDVYKVKINTKDFSSNKMS